MYNQEVINRLNNLTYLANLKNANVTCITKKNEFGDIVKFFAQINKENVIQKISFKATGCSSFMALCSYFCEIVTGKTIDDAKKITSSDLEKFSKLDEQKTHVYAIILDTFAMLIKKYEKGIKNGTIVPCEVSNRIEENSKTTKAKKNKRVVDHKVEKELQEILNIDTHPVKKIKVKEKKVKDKPAVSQVETKIVVEKDTDNNIIQTTKTETIIETKLQAEKTLKDTMSQTEPENIATKLQPKSEISNNHSVEIAERLKAHTSVIKEHENKTEKISDANQNKLSHLNALNLKLKSKETNDKMQNNSKNLSDMLTRIHSVSAQSQNIAKENSKKLEDTKKDNKKTDIKEKPSKEKNKEEKPKKEKKSLFGWLLGKK